MRSWFRHLSWSHWRTRAPTAARRAERAPVPPAPPPADPSPPPPRPATTVRTTFRHDGVERPYTLHTPAGLGTGAPRPLLVMLHGCQQSPDDFALGTRMSDEAERRGLVVAYPGQGSRENLASCWNWFDAAHQQRGHGEVAWIAALTQHLVAGYPLDPRRLYLAGLSAGGAMALATAAAYPDLYAAVASHSGVPSGIADSLGSGLAAMRHGPRERLAGEATIAPWPRVPTLAIHGDADTVVHPDNSLAIYRRTLDAFAADGLVEATRREPASDGSRAHQRHVAHRADATAPVAELWLIEAAGHAWSGGDVAGSFVDAPGPNASRAILDFLLQHERRDR